MSVWFVQGKLGAGKGITSVARIREYVLRGCQVATNMDLYLDHLVSPFDKSARIMRIPDQPRLIDFQNLGSANDTYDENKNGLIVLDECATWFNARSWNDKGRAPVIDWLVHCRKHGWDLIIQIQDVAAVDSQARGLIMEHVATCMRTDKMNIPFVGFIYKQFTGKKMPVPKVHIAKVIYTATDTFADRWTTGGRDYHTSYDTKQIFSPAYIAHDAESGVAGVYSYLPGWYFSGQFLLKHDKAFYMRLSKVYFTKLRLTIAFIAGCLLAGSVSLALAIYLKPTNEPVKIAPPPIVNRAITVLPDLFTVGTIDIDRDYGRYQKTAFQSEKVTDGERIYYIGDFLARGFGYKRFTNCYQELTSTDGVVTPIFCRDVKPEEDDNQAPKNKKNAGVFQTDEAA